MIKRPIMQSKARQGGVGLVEILIALLVLAIGVLGYAGLQLAAIKKAEDANNKALATLIAQDALERVMLNPDEYTDYTSAGSWPSSGVAIGGAPPKDCISNECTAKELLQFDIDSIRWQAANSLPDGRVAMTSCGQMACMVVSWNGVTPDSCVQNGDVSQDQEGCAVIEVRR